MSNQKERCIICDCVENVEIEPRFNYPICRKHASVPPTTIQSILKRRILIRTIISPSELSSEICKQMYSDFNDYDMEKVGFNKLAVKMTEVVEDFITKKLIDTKDL